MGVYEEQVQTRQQSRWRRSNPALDSSRGAW
jgi:hypothetical protein